jgi:hypothetical protein
MDFNTNFLGIILDNRLHWKKHTDAQIIKLNAACYAIRTLNHMVPQETLLMINFSYFHSIMSYDINFLGSSPCSITIFRLKKPLRIITGSGSKESCRKIYGELSILILCSQYIFSLLCFVISNKDQCIQNLGAYGRNNRYGLNLHLLVSSLALYQNCTHYMGLKVFDSLPTYINDRQHNVSEFKQLVRNFVLM